jgi:hypothetical protein
MVPGESIAGMHLPEYGQALWAHWWPLMSCAVFTLFGLWAALTNKTNRWIARGTLFLAANLLFIASYLAWNDEYEKTHPGLRLTIDTFATSRHSSNQVTSIIMVASVSNVGSPSIAERWSLEVIPVSGNAVTVYASIVFEANPLTLYLDNGKVGSYSPRDALYLKTSSVPLTMGAKETGFLIFDFPTISQAQADARGTVYRLSCLDVFGNKVWTDHTMSEPGQRNAMPYYPGMNEPSIK